MYAYCNDNPIKYKDSDGNCITNARGDNIHYNCKYAVSVATTAQNLVRANHLLNLVMQEMYKTVYKATESYYKESQRPGNMGIGTYKQTVANQLTKIKRVSNQVDYLSKKLGVFLDHACLSIQVGDAIWEDVHSGQSKSKIAWDIAVDTSILVMNQCASDMVGAMVGMYFAGVPGLVIGFLIGEAVDAGLDYLGQNAREELKGW